MKTDGKTRTETTMLVEIPELDLGTDGPPTAAAAKASSPAAPADLNLHVPSFNYDELPKETAATLRDCESKISRLWKAHVNSAIYIGQQLNRAKALLAHGKFEKWVEARLGTSPRTAQNYMRTAECFGDRDKSAIVSLLPASTVYLLASKSTPAAVREEVVDALKSGQEIPPNLIEARVIDAQRQARHEKVLAAKAARRAKRTPESIAKDARREARERREEAKNDKRLAELDAAAQKLNEALMSTISPDAAGALRAILVAEFGVRETALRGLPVLLADKLACVPDSALVDVGRPEQGGSIH